MSNRSRFVVFLAVLALGMSLGVAAEEKPAGAKPDPAVQAVAQGNNRFALDLYAQLREREGNLFFSSYSISSALAMTYAGARGDTAAQMASTLHFGKDPDALHPAFGKLIKQIQGDGKPRAYALHTANALWLQADYRFLPDYLALVQAHYQAELRDVDFKKDAEQVRQTINAWVEKQTRDKIKELFKPGTPNPLSRLVLTNAIYFKGNWATQFKKEATRDEPFLLAGGQKVNAPLMRQTGDFPYHETEQLQVLELPYEGKDLSMVVVLPRKVDGLAGVEKALTAANLDGWLGKLRKTEVVVFLPRFQTTAEFQLNGVLSQMGMKDAFVDGKADFSGMNGSRDLFIQAVVHKAFVDVNEEGTEAAAATGVVIGITSARITPTFRADHPFLYLIRDTRNGSILFLGRVTNPRG
jgi:serpin B